jgi:pyridoxal phosphate enzyme (YggS family)
VSDIASAIAARLAEVRGRIAAAASRCGRDPATVRLVAVSKTYGAEHVAAAIAAGQRDFGENKVQEGLQKIGAVADTTIRWHLIGHLQSNKARKAGEAFDWVHAVDSVGLLQKIDAAAAGAGRRPRLLVQVDLAGEATKHGAAPGEVTEIFAAAGQCIAAELVGLMLLPPAVEDPEEARPWFQRLRRVRDELAAAGVPPGRLSELSMGMSHDFEVAVEEGATIVRVGSAIFGPRG